VFWNLIRPLFFSLQPEAAHHLAFGLLEQIQPSKALRKTLESHLRASDPRLVTKVFGLEFPNPLGLAAGFDKNGQVLPIWQSLGFGFAELGTITPRPQPGNPTPRLFRLKQDQALINRMGFNNEGAEKVHHRLVRFLNEAQWPVFPVGINLGKQKETSLDKAVEDYLMLLDTFLDLGDYFVVNVSSPNTPGLRELQEKPRLDALFEALQRQVKTRCKPHTRPLLVKVAPDLEWTQLDDVLELCLKHGLAGIVATNTTLSRAGLQTSIQETGGLSGRPLKERATEFIRYIYQKTQGRLPIIGVGGIQSAEDAYEKIRAGASLIQVYTGYVYEGPMLPKKINEGLTKLLERDGFRSVVDAVGK
jgi:dihydroorotate dehydrogenase